MSEMVADVMFERRDDEMDREFDANNEKLNNEDIDVTYELSDDSDIEILTFDNDEHNSACNENELNTQNIDQKCYLKNSESKEESSTDIEIINLSSDDEGTNNSENKIYESQNEIIDYVSESEGSESSEGDIEIEIETGNEKINIKQNNNSNVDELFLGSDEECVMFDFSNYSAEDVLRAVENNKLLTDKSDISDKNDISNKKDIGDKNDKNDKNDTQNRNVETTEDYIESKIEIKEPEISITDIRTDSDIGARNNNIKNCKKNTKKSSGNNIQFTGRKNQSVDHATSIEVPESCLILKCKKCGTPGFTEININITNPAKRKCPTCEFNMSFQCRICTCLFHVISSFANHLKNFHKRENEEILEKIESLYLGKNVENDVVKKKRTIFKCIHCALILYSARSLKAHKINCHTIYYLYCRFCSLNVDSLKQLREHMNTIHSSIISQSDLNQILDGIEQEGRKMKGMMSIFLVTCVGCNYTHKLYYQDRRCTRCRSGLIYKCGYRQCGLLFSSLIKLTRHVRQCHLHSWHQCNICGAANNKCTEAESHRLLRHPESRITYRHCEQCHYEASSPGDMSSHVLSAHSADPMTVVQSYSGPYKCNDCNKIFKLMHRLVKHQNSFCRKTRTTYRCAHCRYTSVDKEKLLQHLQINHVFVFTGKKLKCNKCGQVLASIYKFNSHIGKCNVKVRKLG